MATDWQDRERLLTLAKAVREALSNSLPQHTVNLNHSRTLDAVETDTDGWVVTVGTVAGYRAASLDTWFDRWAGDVERRVSFVISASDQARIEQFAEILQAEFGTPSVLNDSDVRKGPGGVQTLSRPLATRPLHRPFVELYRDRSFLTRYAPFTSIKSAKNVSALRDVAVSFFRPSVLALRALGGHHDDFPKIKVRAKVREHLVRDRSAAAARSAKERDDYTCRVCGFNYTQLYGKLGERYAEAHHVQPLASLKVGTPIRPADLVTVCANCHRILHKMAGDGKRDLALLKTIVAAAQARRP